MANSWEKISQGFEITVIPDPSIPEEATAVYVADGTNPITETEWDIYTPPDGYAKNTTRYTQFNEHILHGSPDQPDGVKSFFTTSDGYTWNHITNTASANWPYSASDYTMETNNAFDAAIKNVTPPEGVLRVSTTYKNQDIKFYANENGTAPGTAGAIPITRYFLTDGWGNQYIMQSSGASSEEGVEEAFQEAVLPEGWVKSSGYLSEDLVVYPAYGKNNNYEFLLARDSGDNTFVQMLWSDSGYNLAAQIEGLDIWGSKGNDILRITNSWDSTIYGGGGDNTFIFEVDGGTHIIEDFNVATRTRYSSTVRDKLDFNGEHYTVHDTSAGMEIDLSNGGTVILSGIHIFSNSWVV